MTRSELEQQARIHTNKLCGLMFTPEQVVAAFVAGGELVEVGMRREMESERGGFKAQVQKLEAQVDGMKVCANCHKCSWGAGEPKCSETGCAVIAYMCCEAWERIQ